MTIYGPPGQKIDRASHAARQLMGTAAGRNILTQYVMTGKAEIEEENTLINQLFQKAIRMITKQKDHILKTLETRDDHDQRHQTMMQLAT